MGIYRHKVFLLICVSASQNTVLKLCWSATIHFQSATRRGQELRVLGSFIAITKVLVCNDLEVCNTENKSLAVDDTPQTIIGLMHTSHPPPPLPGPQRLSC